MKIVLSNKIMSIVGIILFILLLAFNLYMLARPISYDMGYTAREAYSGGTFEGTIKLRADNTMRNRNTNFGQELESRYYYKDGYLFFVEATTDEAYAQEVAYINENFEEAKQTPFYAAKVNAFQLRPISEDGYDGFVYTCMPAVIFVIFGVIADLALLGIVFTSLSIRKKRNPAAQTAVQTE